MKKFFSTDIAMKILSLFLAIILWIYLMVVLNPDMEITVADVPVSFSGHQTLLQNHFAITNETQNTISLKLKGARGILANVNKDNITAYVDLSGYSQEGSFSLPIHVRLPYEELSVTDKKPYNLTVVIDSLISRQFKVAVQVTGTPKADYAVLSTSSAQTMVEVTGPEDVVKTIDKAVVQLDANGASTDIAQLTPVQLLDSNGNLITHKALSTSPGKIEAYCIILRQKTVPVQPVLSTRSQQFTPGAVSPGEVVLLGAQQTLDAISSIATAPIDATSQTGDFTATTTLVIPDGVHLRDAVPAVTVEVKVKR